MAENLNRAKEVIDNRFSSYVSNCPTVTERFSEELIQHNDDINKLKSNTCYSASEKVKAFKRVYESADKSKFYSFSTDSLVRLLYDELRSTH